MGEQRSSEQSRAILCPATGPLPIFYLLPFSGGMVIIFVPALQWFYQGGLSLALQICSVFYSKIKFILRSAGDTLFCFLKNPLIFQVYKMYVAN